jgi:hypothetical protein
VPADTLAFLQSTGKADPTAAAGPAGEKPVSIWWYFLLALLGMAVVESIFAGKYVDPEERQPLAARKQAA